MCVHVFCGDDLPNATLVWVDSREGHTLVYADSSLAVDGRLTAVGSEQINRALAAIAGAPSLETAKPCL